MIPAREACADTVMEVHHTRHSIKAEAIKLVFLHPEPQIAHEKAQNFMLPIVEETAIPEVMSSLATIVEVLVVSSVEMVDSI